MQLYSDPTCRQLVQTAAEKFGVETDEILFTNGSDEALNFAFMAFCDPEHPAVFPDITYGFYPVFAVLNGIPFETIPLKDDFSIAIHDYLGIEKNIFLANPNAPTGLALSKSDIERIVESNPHHVVVVDEAYVDFGAESCIDLIHQYDNILVCGTFSKSRSLAGGRLGFAVGNKNLIADLNTVKFSTNPYNVNRMTMAAGIGALCDESYFKNNCKAIMETREWAAKELKKLGFMLTDSVANFLFAKHPNIAGKELYLLLKQKGVLIRHFETDRLQDYNRITVGSLEQMQVLLAKVKEILEERT